MLLESEPISSLWDGKIWEFPTIRGTLFWRPYSRDPTIQGTILPIFRNTHIHKAIQSTAHTAYVGFTAWGCSFSQGLYCCFFNVFVIVFGFRGWRLRVESIKVYVQVHIHAYIHSYIHSIHIYGSPPKLSTSFGVNTPDPQSKRLLCVCVCVYFEPQYVCVCLGQ